MYDSIETNSSDRNPVNRLHFTVGFLVLVTITCISVFAIRLLLMR